MKVFEDRKDVIYNILVGVIVVHYGSILANLIFLSNNGLIGAIFNFIFVIIWTAIAFQATKKRRKALTKYIYNRYPLFLWYPHFCYCPKSDFLP